MQARVRKVLHSALFMLRYSFRRHTLHTSAESAPSCCDNYSEKGLQNVTDTGLHSANLCNDWAVVSRLGAMSSR